jgi:hypothetical protein
VTKPKRKKEAGAGIEREEVRGHGGEILPIFVRGEETKGSASQGIRITERCRGGSKLIFTKNFNLHH